MVDSRYLPTPNQRIEITEATDASPGSRRVYFTRVEDVRDEVITVVCPMSEGEVVPLREGMQVTVTYIRHRALLSFDARVVARVWGDVPRLRLTRPTEVTRVQRRSYLRMAAAFPVLYAPLGSDQDADDVVPLYRAESVDISAGGLRVRLIDTVVGIRFSSYVRVEFSLPGKDARFDLIAQVMRIEQSDRIAAATFPSSEDVITRGNAVDVITDQRYRYRLALRFANITQPEQDCIMKFVFDRERELIERGMVER
jgi:c-di-GMP-binding flagellar brake protein YcgR